MQRQNSIRILEILQYLYLRTDEDHPTTVADILEYLQDRGIHAVRQTVYGDLQDLISAGIDVVVTKSTQNQYFIGNRLFEYPELKMLTDAVASSKVISAEKTNELIQKLCRLTSEAEAMQLRRFRAGSSRIMRRSITSSTVSRMPSWKTGRSNSSIMSTPSRKNEFSNIMAISISWTLTPWSGRTTTTI